MDEPVSIDVADGIMTVTLNRPERLNAYTAAMGEALAGAFDAASADDSVRVVIVTGAGRAFCAGADMGSGSDSFGGDGAKLFGGNSGTPRKGGFIAAIYECTKPSIAAINGPATGVGLTLTLPMDIRIAAEGAKLGFVFTRRGLVPEAGSAWFLPRLVGLPQALRWCLEGNIFLPEEALAAGLIGDIAPAGTVLDRARAIARTIADNTAPVATAITRQLLWRFMSEPSPLPLLRVDGTLNRELGGSADVAEGVGAFLEKRSPAFPGRVSADLPPEWKRYAG